MWGWAGDAESLNSVTRKGLPEKVTPQGLT